jgi:hypothetical protein
MLKGFIDLQKEQLQVEKAKAEADKAKLELVKPIQRSHRQLVTCELDFVFSACLPELPVGIFSRWYICLMVYLLDGKFARWYMYL